MRPFWGQQCLPEGPSQELPLGPQAGIWILSNSEVAYIIHSCTLYSLITKTNWQGQSLSIGS